MPIYRVQAPVHATTTIYVEADSREDVLEKADSFEGQPVSICHQCNREIDDPTIGQVDAQCDAYEVTEENDIAEAEEWIEMNG